MFYIKNYSVHRRRNYDLWASVFNWNRRRLLILLEWWAIKSQPAVRLRLRGQHIMSSYSSLHHRNPLPVRYFLKEWLHEKRCICVIVTGEKKQDFGVLEKGRDTAHRISGCSLESDAWMRWGWWLWPVTWSLWPLSCLGETGTADICKGSMFMRKLHSSLV